MPTYLAIIALGAGLATAAPASARAGIEVPPARTQDEIVSYPQAFFEKYEPASALDMVLQLPGFQIDDGGEMRGFGVAAGNILINDRRPSVKQDLPSAILRRIPADIVDRIELIRGQVGAIDVQGHAVVANVVLAESYPASIRWDASLRKHSNVTPLRGEVSISLSDRWKSIDYTAGVSGFRATFGDKGTEDILGGSGALLEERFDHSSTVNRTGDVHLNASAWAGETLLSLNTSLGYVNRDEALFSHRVPRTDAGTLRDALFGNRMITHTFEIGMDGQRALTNELSGRAIVLLQGSRQEKLSDERTIQAGGDQTLYRAADSTTDTTESIIRLELDWTGWTDHVLEASLEGASNALDNALVRIDDVGAGPVIVDVPGANGEIEELRFDLLLQDTWVLGAWTINYGLGAETSTISQSGDANLERDYFFLKPQLQVTWTQSQSEQTRLRLVREVAQLDFNDFVSATVFLDDDLALGNPNLKPESTWSSQVTHERRFGDLAVFSLTAFHDWISDVQDLLPITSEFEAPGNIGDGRRWGFEIQGTVPLEWAALAGARLDFAARWQESSVVDPVTGQERDLGALGGFDHVPTVLPFRDENAYAWSIDFRQDLAASEVAWGWAVKERADRPRFKVNELDVYDEVEPVVDLFVESTRWWGVKLGLEINNLLDLTALRDRTIYAGRRGLSGIDRREVERYSLGRRYTLTISGSF